MNRNKTPVALFFFGLVLALPVAAFAAGPAAVNLGAASTFVILAKTGISTTGSTAVLGDLGVSPAAATAITGFALTLPSAGAFSTSAIVSGKVYAPGYADPTPATLTTAVLDMQTAYIDAAGRAAGVTELGAGTIGGLTLVPGVYKWGTGVTIPTDVTLAGSAGDVWIFQIAQTLTVSSGVKVVLSGGAQASNVFWVVGGQTTVGTDAAFAGTILDQTAVVLTTGATLNGRALAQTAVTLDSNSLTIPSGISVTPTPVVTSTPAPAAGSSQGSGTGYAAPIPSTNTGGTMTTTTNTFVPTGSSSGAQVRSIAISLQQGIRGSDVITLQQFLIAQNEGTAARTLAAVGATGYFGVLTRSALAEFQANAGITPALGNFGPITRAYLSAHY